MNLGSLRKCELAHGNLPAAVGFLTRGEKNTPLSFLRQCQCFHVLACTYSSTSVTYVLKHSKRARSVFSQRVCFPRCPLTHHQFPRIPRAPKARAMKIGDFPGNIAQKIHLNVVLEFIIHRSWESIHNSLFLASQEAHYF